MRKAMEAAARVGTARTIGNTYRGRDPIAAKTGTAETGGRKRPDALFVALTPQHVIVAIAEHGGKGASLGPLVGEIANLTQDRP